MPLARLACFALDLHAPEGPKWVGPRGWAHVGPTHLVGGPNLVGGPTWAQARNLGPQKIKKSKSVLPKMSARFFMPEKGIPAPFGALPAHFLRGPEKSKNCPKFAHFPWWAHGAHGPYSPGLGPLLLSTRGGAIGSYVET